MCFSQHTTSAYSLHWAVYSGLTAQCVSLQPLPTLLHLSSRVRRHSCLGVADDMPERVFLVFVFSLCVFFAGVWLPLG